PVTSKWKTLSGPGVVTYADSTQPVTQATFTDPGTYTLQLTGTDSHGAASSDTCTVTVNAPAGAPPTVSITAPTDGATITKATDVKGTVSGGFWAVKYRFGGPNSGNQPVEFGSGN